MSVFEFFDLNLAQRIISPDRLGDDPVRNVLQLAKSVAMANGRPGRLASTWIVVTSDLVITRAALADMQNVRVETEATFHQVAAKAILSGPCGIIMLDKKAFNLNHLFVTFDPRAITICTNLGPVRSGPDVEKIKKEIACLTQK